MKVRDGNLESFNLEKVAGPFVDFSSGATNNFDTARQAAVTGGNEVLLPIQEGYVVDVCFIDTDDPANRYIRRSLKSGTNDCANAMPTYMLCDDPDPSLPGYSADAATRNDFDIHLSIEQPTREIHANVFAVDSTGVPTYSTGSIQPNGTGKQINPTTKDGTGKRESDEYEGVRLVMMTNNGLKRSIDMYKTGLVSTKADDITTGCVNVPPGTIQGPGPTGPTGPPSCLLYTSPSPRD